jgi:RimJ/RimL family protein N-acetyltransferase
VNIPDAKKRGCVALGVTIRPANKNDANALWGMMSALDNETKYMMYEPNERTRDDEKINSLIKQAVTGGDLLLVADAGGEIVGYISAQRGGCRRIKHTAYIVVGIRKQYQNQGIGKQFFKQLDIWADQKGVTRLELTVMCNNEAAKHLYEINGFVVEGLKKNSMFVDGEYVDEYYMAKLRRQVAADNSRP